MKSESSNPISPLLRVMKEKVVPWAAQWDDSRIVLARARMDDLALPTGVGASLKEITSRRKAVKASRIYGYAITTARWPEEHLEETRLPSLACILGGTTDFRIGNYTLHCGEGHFVFVPSGVPHADGSTAHIDESRGEQGSCDILWIYHWEGGIVCHICHSRGQRHWNFDSGENCFIPNRQAMLYFDMMIEETMSRMEGHQSICRGLLLSLVTLLQREMQAGRIVQPGMAENIAAMHGVSLRGADPMLRAQEHIRSHLDQPLSIDEVAQLVYMSRAHFTKQFRRATGKSFVEFLTDERLSKAQNLLCETDWSLDVICKFTGFKTSHFRDLFRRRIGMAPTEYRRRERAAQ